MIWLIIGEESHQIISSNVCNKGDMYELWVTRPNGKSLKIDEGNKEKITEIKDAIDYAIEIGASTFKIE